ncbi:type III pantothenate kinase [Pseudomaricurvus sp. HS19]|uniref:type III pantothenate kinase n=1 Tax=Pseudomaricurvus sp. HS19 TaxID=2692626 RepID=UPI00136EA3FA|nr:type III pantothenate kinase [Pseudomaricurvus sp. HS19]MYM65205.1 type III pantothenate kinase [Pseudomaricurvus sp. HS19]
MQLQLDIGNTRIKWRCLQGGAVVRRGVVSRRDAGDDREVLRQLTAAAGAGVVEVLVASVAGAEFDRLLDAHLDTAYGVRPRFARATAEAAGVTSGYAEPQRLGVDRWLAVLATSRFPGDRWLVLDCGSAVTLDVLQAGSHLGGYIVPGLRLMSESLFAQTAQVKVGLPRVEGSQPGTTTEEAVGRGVRLMVAGLVREAVCHLEGPATSPLVLTGGDAAAVAGLLRGWPGLRIEEDLVLDGLPLAECRLLDI